MSSKRKQSISWKRVGFRLKSLMPLIQPWWNGTTTDYDMTIGNKLGRNFLSDTFVSFFCWHRRDALQKLSPTPGEYPQFFVVDDNEETSYVGDLQRLQDIDEDSALPESIIGAHPLIMTWERLLGAGYRNKLLLIISTMKICRKQTYRQERAMQLLRAKRIPFETLDAADQSLVERCVSWAIIVWLLHCSIDKGNLHHVFVIADEISCSKSVAFEANTPNSSWLRNQGRRITLETGIPLNLSTIPAGCHNLWLIPILER